MRYMSPPKKNNNLPFRVYYREVRPMGVRKERWKWLASFVWKADARAYMETKQDPMYDHKMMHGNRNVKVF